MYSMGGDVSSTIAPQQEGSGLGLCVCVRYCSWYIYLTLTLHTSDNMTVC